MKLRILTFILLLYPFFSFGECNVLIAPYIISYSDRMENSEQDITYNMILREYADKFNNDYRPESFFTKRLKLIEYRKSRNIDFKNLSNDDWLTKDLLRYHHFDESINDSFMGLAEERFSPSFYCLGYIYEAGIGQKVDYAKAWAWFYTASSVDGIYAKIDLDRLSGRLSVSDEVKAKGLADKYVRLYTDFTETPSVVIIK